jgi:hypothetical protein
VTLICEDLLLVFIKAKTSAGGELPTRYSIVVGTWLRIKGKMHLEKYSAASTFGSYAKLHTQRIDGPLPPWKFEYILFSRKFLLPYERSCTILGSWSIPLGIIWTSTLGSNRFIVA